MIAVAGCLCKPNGLEDVAVLSAGSGVGVDGALITRHALVLVLQRVIKPLGDSAAQRRRIIEGKI